MTSPFSALGDLSRFNPFSKSKSESCESLVDEEESRVSEKFGEPSGSKKARRQSKGSGVFTRRH